MDKEKIFTIIIISIIIISALGILFLKNYNNKNINLEDAMIIGNNSILYVQTGCSHCKEQEDLFGENIKYLKIINCLEEIDTCINNNITVTPTWIINNKKYEGFKSLKELINIINEK